MTFRWKGNKDFEKRQIYMSYLIYKVIEMVSCTVTHTDDADNFIYSTEERIKLYKLQVDLLELFYPDGDYLFDAQLGEIACSNIVTILLSNHDFENAWHWLEKGAEFAIHMDTYDFEAAHTSLVLRGYVEGGWIMEADGNRTQSLLEWLTTDGESVILRSDARYETLVNLLKKTAKIL